MTKKQKRSEHDDNFPVTFSPEALRGMKDDPVFADNIRAFVASLRQADLSVRGGQHDDFQDAMEALTGQRGTPMSLRQMRKQLRRKGMK